MSTLNPPKTISKRKELRQDRVVTAYARAVDYADKNRSTLYIALGVVVLLLVAVGFYFFAQQQKSEEAQTLLGAIVGAYENEDYQTALDGTADTAGLIEIADDFGGTKAGNLARFYAADALFRLGEYDEALRWFQAYDAGETIVGASALAGEAAIYEMREEYERAGDLYREAALIFDHELTSPDYLLDAGRAYEAGGAYDEAIEIYELIEERYSETPAARDLELLVARARTAMR